MSKPKVWDVSLDLSKETSNKSEIIEKNLLLKPYYFTI
jgi:phage pi2 protein 07